MFSDRTRTRLVNGLPVWALGELIAFGFFFGIGTLAGVASPGGWPAWHIGALVASIGGGLCTILFTAILIDYLEE